MKTLNTLISLTFLAGAAASCPAQAKNYPPGGTLTGLQVSPATVTAGDMVTFTVQGSGNCAFTIFGFPSQGMNDLRKTGTLPLTFSVPAEKVGTLSLLADPVHETTDPLWCNGTGGKATLTVKPKVVAAMPNLPNTAAAAGPVANQVSILPTGRITGLTLADKSIGPNDKLKVMVTGDNGQCKYHLKITHGATGLSDSTARSNSFARKGSTETFLVPLINANGSILKGNYTASVDITGDDQASNRPCTLAAGSYSSNFSVTGKAGPITGVKPAKPKFAYGETPQIIVTGEGVCGFRLLYTNTKTQQSSEFQDYSAPFGAALDARWTHVKPGFDPGTYEVRVMKYPDDPNHCDVAPNSTQTTAQFVVTPPAVDLSTLDIAPVKPTFAYGERQDYAITGQNAGKCYYDETVLIKKPGNTYFTGIANPTKRTVTIPDSSVTDLKLPEGDYQVRLSVSQNTLADGTTPNGCVGSKSIYFTVVPGITRITGITPAKATVLTGKPFDFRVTGQNEGTGLPSGDCAHDVQLRKSSGNTVAASSGPLGKLPSTGSIVAPAPGDYILSAQPTDTSSKSNCTGSAKNQFIKVIDRVSCIGGGKPYDAADEYGCYGYVPSDEYWDFQCPDGYTGFRDKTQPNPHFGCRKNGSAAMVFSAAALQTLGLAQAAAPAVAGQPAQPQLKITGMSLVRGRSPDASTVHSDEGLKVNITGNVSNAAGYGVHCYYTVTAEEQKSGKKTEASFSTFDQHALSVKEPGTYNILATSTAKDKAKGATCDGKAEIKNVKLIQGAAVLTNFTLETWGHHIGMASDGGYPQFCENCNSLFSPAHDIGLVKNIPQFVDGPTCAYTITHDANGSKQSWPRIKEQGKSVAAAQTDYLYPPFLNAYGNDQTNLKVTVAGATNPLRPDLPACEGSITKSITVYDDPAKPKQQK